MADCGISGGLSCPSCEEIQWKGGLVKNIYVGVLSELDTDTPFEYSAAGEVTAINFQTYAGLYKFCTKNRSNATTQELVEAESGLKYWTQSVSGKFQQQTQVAKNIIDELKIVDDLFVVVETNNGTFEVFFIEAGGKMTVATKGSGVNIGDDATFIFTIASAEASGEDSLAPNFGAVGTPYATLKEQLEDYVVS
jgi:hypothetical protein